MTVATTRAVYGTLAGELAASAMSLFRIALRRAGQVDVELPERVERDLASRLHLTPADRKAHQTLHQILHHAYGGAWGAVYGLLFRKAKHPIASGVLFGSAVWLVSEAVLLPASRTGRPLWRGSLREHGIALATHALYGAATAMVLEDYLAADERQTPVGEGARVS